MSYIVIARRYRPQKFTDIIGQEHVSKTLANAIENNRIAHSFIFSGPRGVGKTTTARILAKALNCENGPTANPCNKCSSCESITKGNSLDVLEIDGASNRGIDEIRNLRENIRFTPTLGKYRIYIIDEVHMLTKEAFNALLKTLEEPPGHAVFIFATTEIHRVPATILSRCQRFDFKRMSIKTIISHLESIAKSEKLDIEKDALLQIAKKADGSMRDSQSILDQIISYAGNKITAAEVADVLGIISDDLYFEFTEKIRDGDLKNLLLLCNRVFAEGYDLAEFLNGFEEHFRNLLVLKTLQNFDQINVAEHYHDQFRSVSKLFEVTDLLAYIKQVGDMQNAIKWATQPNLKFELGILKMAKMPTTLEIETLLQKIDLLKKKTDTEQPPPASPQEISLSSLKNVWPQLTSQFRETKVNLATALEIGEIKSLQGTNLVIEYANSDVFYCTWLNKNKRLVEEELYKQFSSAIHLVINKVDKPGSGINKNNERLNKKEMTRELEKDPVLNKLIDEFGLEIT